MSDSSKSRSGGVQAQPKAIIHKQILDAAAEAPQASMAELADSVSGASTELVEQVLDRYGDPSAAETATADDTTAATADDTAAGDTPESDAPDADDAGVEATDGDGVTGDAKEADSDGAVDDRAAVDETDAEAGDVDDGGDPDAPTPDDLSPKQLRVLRAVADDPDATQRELADRLGVSTATISNRVNAVEGFDWSRRAALVDALFADGAGADDGAADATAAPDPEPSETDGGTPPGADDDGADGGGETGGAAEGQVDETAEDETGEPTGGDQETGEEETTAPPETEDLRSAVAALSAEVEALTERLEAVEAGTGPGAEPDGDTAPDCGGAFADPELAHKVIHACVRSDAITEEEELRIVENVVAPNRKA